jgi:hypothetical protein
MLTWRDDNSFVLCEKTFYAVDPFYTSPPAPGQEGLVVFKAPELVERYAALVAELKPQFMFELGMFGGGSTLFFTEIARPRKIVAIDLEPVEGWRDRIERGLSDSGLADAVLTFGGVNQGDRARLAKIADEAFEGAPLDLVLDDCSHLYEETRDSFNELFPRLRPGGVYAIEDWYWAHTAVGQEPLEGLFPSETPLTRLVFEIVLAIPGMPGLISDVSIESRVVIVRRGEAAVDPATFDISACSNPRGRRMLGSSRA